MSLPLWVKASSSWAILLYLEHQSVFGKIGRHTGGRRIAKRQQTAACFHQQAVGMSVVAAFKFDDFVAAGKTAYQTNGGHRCFRTGLIRRSCSTDGMILAISSAMTISPSVGAPNDKPPNAASRTASMTSGWAWPTIAGPKSRHSRYNACRFRPKHTRLLPFDKARHAADAAKCAHRRVHAAGNNGFGAVEQAFITVHDKFFRKRSSENQIGAILTPNPFRRPKLQNKNRVQNQNYSLKQILYPHFPACAIIRDLLKQ